MKIIIQKDHLLQTKEKFVISMDKKVAPENSKSPTKKSDFDGFGYHYFTILEAIFFNP